MPIRTTAGAAALLALSASLTLGTLACGGKKAPIDQPVPPPPAPSARPPAPSVAAAEPTVVPPAPIGDDAVSSASLDDLNRNSPLRPAFFALDSSEIAAAAQTVLNANAAVMGKYPSWIVTIEGHCDERGTAEYNLALGERRAAAARAYLVSLGIAADRLRTVSYGKEFPFDPAHDESAWAKNRRAHFVVTAK